MAHGLTTPNAVVHGVQDDGTLKKIASTAEGHLEMAIHAPRLPFGAVHTENMTPIFQTDAVYGINSGQTQPTVTSGSVL